MAVVKRPYNELGVWLNNELGKRNITVKDFAAIIREHTKSTARPYNMDATALTHLMRSKRTLKTQSKWQSLFIEIFKQIDRKV